MRINQYKTMLAINSQIAYLVKEQGFNYKADVNLTSPESIYDCMISHYRLSEEAVEQVYMLAFNSKMKLIGTFKISEGTINASILSPREIFQKALLCNAANIILLHNHPSGNTSPSREDISASKRIVDSGKLIGIALCDHLIIGNGYTSLKEQGLL